MVAALFEKKLTASQRAPDVDDADDVSLADFPDPAHYRAIKPTFRLGGEHKQTIHRRRKATLDTFDLSVQCQVR